VALQDNSVVVPDGNGGGSDCNITTGIAELANGEEWLSGELQYHMPMVCHGR